MLPPCDRLTQAKSVTRTRQSWWTRPSRARVAGVYLIKYGSLQAGNGPESIRGLHPIFKQPHHRCQVAAMLSVPRWSPRRPDWWDFRGYSTVVRYLIIRLSHHPSTSHCPAVQYPRWMKHAAPPDQS